MLSGTSEGRYLDLAHFGAVIDPRPLPTCPKDGFVVFKEQFTAEEQDRLRAIVASKEYQSLRATESDYYVAAWLRWGGRWLRSGTCYFRRLGK